MARINLLPWREAARQQRRQEFLTALGIALGLTAVVVALVHFYFEDRISGQQARNQYLKTEIAALDRKIKEIDEIERTKADLLSRMDIIQRLQKSRPEIVRLFDELVTALPEGVYLTKLEQSERSVTLEGRAQSNARVSAFMRRIEGSQSIGQPRLMLIENKDKTGTGLSHFRLSFNQISPEPEPPVKKPAKPTKQARKPARKT
ncbi:PilN domain-containing protein [Allochromatium humboldtianum]|jgi:type IV pilus assembly protein PilN|uniref:PilN domain-containing protein n=1 Tax=Allochromatium humboldtianum TaxID=504901 RepID=A0A850RGC1_9GAMM|nr:PilN domain-containing protein [Allochromatium humboldtianum]NVZ10212.1 PilN domain-containing protein [Allochromatium humboldtianum]